MLGLIREIFRFMKVYNKFWMAPIIFGLLGLGVLLVAAQGSAISPFIYAIF